MTRQASLSVPVFLGLALLLATTGAVAQTPTFFISEYVDGTGDDNAVEFFNGTGAPIHLGDYFLRIRFKDQPGVMLTAQLTAGTYLPSGEAWVLTNYNAGPALLALADQTSTLVEFNGDDAITLATWNGATYDTVDSIGQWDVDPGDYWGCVDGDTQDVTMRRKYEICSGDPDEFDAFTPCPEWDFTPQDAFDDLGVHSAICAGVVSGEAASWGAVKSLYR